MDHNTLWKTLHKTHPSPKHPHSHFSFELSARSHPLLTTPGLVAIGDKQDVHHWLIAVTGLANVQPRPISACCNYGFGPSARSPSRPATLQPNTQTYSVVSRRIDSSHETIVN
jgi:hypothetical protein